MGLRTAKMVANVVVVMTRTLKAHNPPPTQQATPPLPSFHCVLLSRYAQARGGSGELGTTCGVNLKNLRAGNERSRPLRSCVSVAHTHTSRVTEVRLLYVCELKAV